MKDTILITITLMLGVYFFSRKSNLPPLQQMFIFLISCFIFSVYISVFGDDLKWWSVRNEQYTTFKIFYIFAKTILTLLCISAISNKKRLADKINILLFSTLLLDLMDLLLHFLNIVAFKPWWFLFGPFIYTATLTIILSLNKKYGTIISKERGRNNETSPSS